MRDYKEDGLAPFLTDLFRANFTPLQNQRIWKINRFDAHHILGV